MSTTIRVSDLQTAQGLQLIDVRTPSEFASGHVPGAVNIPMDQVELRLADLCADAPVVLICQGGKRASITAEWLKQKHSTVSVLEGGTDAWRKAGLPLVRCVSCRWSLERQVRLGAGLLVLTGVLLAIFVNPAWMYLSMFVGAGLTFAGLTNFCPMGVLLARMPWNKGAKSNPAQVGAAAGSCCS